MNSAIQAEYDRLEEESRRRGASEHFLNFNVLFVDQQSGKVTNGFWTSYQSH
jgi:hypothetical protein